MVSKKDLNSDNGGKIEKRERETRDIIQRELAGQCLAGREMEKR